MSAPPMAELALHLEAELTPGALAEVGSPTAIFAGRRGALLGVASRFGPLYVPGRALYGGHRLRHRLSLYTSGGARLAVLDRPRFPINEVSIHPERPWVALATGSYDGGYSFEGELLLWDWETGEVRSVLPECREVTRVRFDDQGRTLTLLLRPRHEEEFEADNPFDVFLGVRLPASQAWEGLSSEVLAPLRPEPPRAFGFDDGDPSAHDVQERLRRVSNELERRFPGYEQRHHAWDVAWLDDQQLALVHERCLLEVWSLDSTRVAIHVGKGFGWQLLSSARARRYFVHVAQRSNVFEGMHERSHLYALNPETLALRHLHTWDRPYSFSISEGGWLLGRDAHLGSAGGARADLVLGEELATPLTTDLGHYDSFNHFLRLDGAADLYFLQGTPRTSHENKRLMRWDIRAAREVPLWPLEWSNAGNRHLMDCAAQKIDEHSIAFSCRIHSPRPDAPYEGYLTRRRLNDGAALWQYPIRSQVTALQVSTPHRCLVYALTSGEVGLLDLATGALRWSSPLQIGGADTVALSLALRGDRLAVGTIDGRALLFRLG